MGRDLKTKQEKRFTIDRTLILKWAIIAFLISLIISIAPDTREAAKIYLVIYFGIFILSLSILVGSFYFQKITGRKVILPVEFFPIFISIILVGFMSIGLISIILFSTGTFQTIFLFAMLVIPWLISGAFYKEKKDERQKKILYEGVMAAYLTSLFIILFSPMFFKITNNYEIDFFGMKILFYYFVLISSQIVMWAYYFLKKNFWV